MNSQSIIKAIPMSETHPMIFTKRMPIVIKDNGTAKTVNKNLDLFSRMSWKSVIALVILPIYFELRL